jgi:hypothetical protein
MKRPDEVNLSREEGAALIERLEGDALTAEDRNVLVQVLRVYFWLLFALQEAKISLKRLRTLLFGQKPKALKGPPAGEASASGGGDRGSRVGAAEAAEDTAKAEADRRQSSHGGRRPGHGRQGADA